jgi:peptidoglycan-N-acetylglucosamine deacetylase
MFYVTTKPAWLRPLYGRCLWNIQTDQKEVYLTFDDGPHPEHTLFVLEELKKYNALATFFCIGKNVSLYPHVYKMIADGGHSIGNHTNSHLDGWRTNSKSYFSDIEEATQIIKSSLFRPPYGHITPFKVKTLARKYRLKTVMWSVLAGDFDTGTSPERCYKNVMDNIKPGQIIVFHDNDLAAHNLRLALPKILENLSIRGYRFKRIEE